MLRMCTAMTVVLATFVVFCAAASAKGSSRVTLESPGLRKRAAAGERIRIAWSQDGPARLPIADSRVARTVVRSLGVYVTLRGGSGEPTAKVAARSLASGTRGLPSGRYIADATVPVGGITSLGITVEGLRSRPGAAPVLAGAVPPSRMLIANDPFEAAADDRTSGASLPWTTMAVAIGALALLCGTFFTRNARMLSPP